MTALFVVIAVEQWQSYRRHLPAFLWGRVHCALPHHRARPVGAGPAADAAGLLGVIVVLLLALRSRLENRTEGEEVAAQ